MNKSNKFSPEVRERAVRMVQEHRGEYASLGQGLQASAFNLPGPRATRVQAAHGLRNELTVSLQVRELARSAQ